MINTSNAVNATNETNTYTSNELLTNVGFADWLESLARIYRENPKLPRPYHLENETVFIFCMDKDTLSAAVRAFGSGAKSTDEQGLIFIPQMASDVGIKLQIYGFKDRICQKVQTGTKIIPAQEARVISAQPEREVPTFEWICAPFLDDGNVEAQEKTET